MLPCLTISPANLNFFPSSPSPVQGLCPRQAITRFTVLIVTSTRRSSHPGPDSRSVGRPPFIHCDGSVNSTTFTEPAKGHSTHRPLLAGHTTHKSSQLELIDDRHPAGGLAVLVLLLACRPVAGSREPLPQPNHLHHCRYTPTAPRNVVTAQN